MPKAIDATVVQDPRVNPHSKLSELWLQDLDGYVVVIAGESRRGIGTAFFTTSGLSPSAGILVSAKIRRDGPKAGVGSTEH